MAVKQAALVVLFLELLLVTLFGIFARYSHEDEMDAYPMFQDVHVMIFIGFGFLMTFLRRYGYSAVGFNFLLGALMVQWAILCQGFYQMDKNHHIEVGIDSLFKADIATAAVLISMGVVLGRTSYIQLLIMGIIEIAVFAGNAYLGDTVFKVADAGGSIFVHTFGAYFGLAVSFVLGRKVEKNVENSLEGSRYTSDLFSMLGTIFLWLFWPSFNAIEATGDGQQRAIINTYLALAACCVTTFAISLMVSEHHKFEMEHIQNATLAGGVAVGTSANLMVQPWGAIIVGILAGILSVIGFSKISPWCKSSFGLKDTCGVHNLHGMPGVLAGILGAIMAAIATENMYGKTLYEIYPAMASENMTATAEYNFLQPGDGRSASDQAGYQLLALVATFLIAVITGLLTGLLLNFTKALTNEEHYDDATSWELPEHHTVSKEKPSAEHAQYDNPSFELPATIG